MNTTGLSTNCMANSSLFDQSITDKSYYAPQKNDNVLTYDDDDDTYANIKSISMEISEEERFDFLLRVKPQLVDVFKNEKDLKFISRIVNSCSYREPPRGNTAIENILDPTYSNSVSWTIEDEEENPQVVLPQCEEDNLRITSSLNIGLHSWYIAENEEDAELVMRTAYNILKSFRGMFEKEMNVVPPIGIVYPFIRTEITKSGGKLRILGEALIIATWSVPQFQKIQEVIKKIEENTTRPRAGSKILEKICLLAKNRDQCHKLDAILQNFIVNETTTGQLEKELDDACETGTTTRKENQKKTFITTSSTD
ncbi:unnamed protein product [Caenorhabditis angaria]|uniref:Uncharacterized protein n=1 Tax=Caenorhabditis angaria TaxID=860376 RepID=A0A9P1ID14_9PELO|nr:unnamed protein product [Caenorhabditis angaria]